MVAHYYTQFTSEFCGMFEGALSTWNEDAWSKRPKATAKISTQGESIILIGVE
jgi:hypothetical protein